MKLCLMETWSCFPSSEQVLERALLERYHLKPWISEVGLTDSFFVAPLSFTRCAHSIMFEWMYCTQKQRRALLKHETFNTDPCRDHHTNHPRCALLSWKFNALVIFPQLCRILWGDSEAAASSHLPQRTGTCICDFKGNRSLAFDLRVIRWNTNAYCSNSDLRRRFLERMVAYQRAMAQKINVTSDHNFLIVHE